MSIGLNAIAAAAATVLLAGAAGSASAQPEYGYGELPPAPYQQVGGYAGGGSCGRESFTLLGAHAGLTVLGVDLDAGARLGVPYYNGCSGGYQSESFQPRPEAPPEGPPPYGYAQQGFAQQGYEQQGYAQQGYGYAPQPQPYQGYPSPSYGYAAMPEGPPPAYYGAPCGCVVARGW